MSNLKSEHLVIKNFCKIAIEPMEGKDWLPIMTNGLQILEKHGFECQLGSGTLLGWIREEDKYIHHDTDIDIDVIVRDDGDEFHTRVDNMYEEFIENGFKLIRTQFYDGLPMQVAFMHIKENLIYDLCFFYKNWGSDYCNIYEHGVFIRPDYSVDDVTMEPLLGCDIIYPANYGKYLNGRYGNDWKVPKHMKESGEKDAAKYLILL